MTPALKALHAQVKVWFSETKEIAEVDVKSAYEKQKRATIVDVTMPGAGENANQEYVIPTLEGRPSDGSDGTMPVYTPGAASVSSKAVPNGYIVRIHEDDLNDDRFGILQASVAQVAERAVNWKYTTIAQQIPEGLTKLTVDQLPYFSTGHYVNLRNGDLGTFSNKYSLPLTADNFALLRSKFRTILFDDGLPRHDNVPDTLIVSAKNETLAEQIVANPQLFGGASNPNLDKAKIIVVPEWDSLNGGAYADAWMLARTGSSLVKPLVWNEREPLTISYVGPRVVGPTPSLFHEWMVRGRMVLAFYDPRRALWSAP